MKGHFLEHWCKLAHPNCSEVLSFFNCSKGGANVMCVLSFSPPFLTALFGGTPSHPICDTVSQVEQNLLLVHKYSSSKKSWQADIWNVIVAETKIPLSWKVGFKCSRLVSGQGETQKRGSHCMPFKAALKELFWIWTCNCITCKNWKRYWSVIHRLIQYQKARWETPCLP